MAVAVPSHQAAKLLSHIPPLADQCSRVKMNGCWALMMAFEESLGLDFDGAFVHASPISWIARNNSKPGRNAGGETWVVHASAEWTEAHIDESPAQIQQPLLEEFWMVTGIPSLEPIHIDGHRWRFAIPVGAVGSGSGLRQNSGPSQKSPGNSTTTITQSYLFDAQQGIGVCGDWCAGARVEGAFLSGVAIANRILGAWNANTTPASQQAP